MKTTPATQNAVTISTAKSNSMSRLVCAVMVPPVIITTNQDSALSKGIS